MSNQALLNPDNITCGMVLSSIPYYILYMQVQQSMDGLLKWLDETDRQQQNQARETISVQPDGVRDQLKKGKGKTQNSLQGNTMWCVELW